MTKLIIQIPCHNEIDALPRLLAEIPRTIPGVDVVEILVVDDGSSDGTGAAAHAGGAHHVLTLRQRGGIARAFTAGLDYALAHGADFIVNLDGDGQHPPSEIERLVAPLLTGAADMVVGVRDEASMEHFPTIKRRLESLGSVVARIISGTTVEDAPSGFRAVTRATALRLHVFSRHSYTLETLIQAGQLGLMITTVPIHSKPAHRPSRVVSSVGHYVVRQGLTMIRVFMAYRPFRFFATPGLLCLLAGTLLGLRYVILYLVEDRAGHLQSLLLGALLLGTGALLVLVGLLADLIAVNRRLLEDIDARVKRIEYRDGESFTNAEPPQR